MRLGYRWAKAIWLICWAGAMTIVIFLPVVLAATFSRTGNLAFNLSQVWAWVLIRITGTKLEIRGRDRIEPDRSYVIISNHQSHFDALALVIQLGLQFRWIAKMELRRVPLFGYALYASRNVFIDRGDREKARLSIQQGMDRLPPGVSILFFAEGTRSPDGRLQEFKKGGFAVALARGLPVLPVTVNGSRKVLPRGGMVFHPGPIQVVVGDPIETQSRRPPEDMDGLMQETRQVIQSNLDLDYPDR